MQFYSECCITYFGIGRIEPNEVAIVFTTVFVCWFFFLINKYYFAFMSILLIGNKYNLNRGSKKI